MPTERQMDELLQTYEQLRACTSKTRITVLTVDGQPTFDVPATALWFVVSRQVLERYGVQANGDPHQWHSERYLAEGK